MELGPRHGLQMLMKYAGEMQLYGKQDTESTRQTEVEMMVI